MLRSIFVNANRRLRNGWWIALFFALLAGLLVPLIVRADSRDASVPLYQQLGVILVASLLCQALRRRPIAELVGAFDLKWPVQLASGLATGALLMLAPAALLWATGAVSWHANPAWSSSLTSTLTILALAAAAEELLFRGFIFQRLIDGVGMWPAQLLIGALFTLTHSDALKEAGAIAYLAGANIFVASVLFGLAFVRTRSLALPFGLHFAANVTQGPILGFGVSGNNEPGLLAATLSDAPTWLTGGAFGLEASVPGFVSVLVLTLLLWRWRGSGVRPAKQAAAAGA